MAACPATPSSTPIPRNCRASSRTRASEADEGTRVSPASRGIELELPPDRLSVDELPEQLDAEELPHERANEARPSLLEQARATYCTRFGNIYDDVAWNAKQRSGWAAALAVARAFLERAERLELGWTMEDALALVWQGYALRKGWDGQLAAEGHPIDWFTRHAKPVERWGIGQLNERRRELDAAAGVAAPAAAHRAPPLAPNGSELTPAEHARLGAAIADALERSAA